MTMKVIQKIFKYTVAAVLAICILISILIILLALTKLNQNSFGTKNLVHVLNFMLINIQSIVTKKEAFWELLNIHAPDIIVRCET